MRRKKRHRFKKKRSILKSRYFWLFILFLIILSVFFHFLVFSKKFYIEEIKVSGNEKIKTENIEKIIYDNLDRKFLLFRTKSIFLVRKKKIKNEILKNYPKIGKVEIKRKFPRTLFFQVKERKSVAVFCPKESCFLIDNEGIVFEVQKGKEKDNLEITFFENKKDPFLLQEVIKDDVLDLILNIDKNLGDKFGIKVRKAITDEEKKLNITTEEGWLVFFNLAGDIDLQVVKLNLLLKKEISPDERKILKYIDLRFSKAFVSPPEIL